MTPDETTALLDDLKAKHGTCYLFDEEQTGLDIPLVFRHPAKLEFSRFMKERSDEETAQFASHGFATKLVVYPDPAAWTKIVDGQPGLPTPIANEIAAACGIRKLEAKKL